VYEEGLLDGVVREMYVLIGDTANFVIDYAKRGPANTPTPAQTRRYIFEVPSLADSRQDYDKIRALHKSFGQLKEEFDGAVDVVALTITRKSGTF
jgi:hypothetical protein